MTLGLNTSDDDDSHMRLIFGGIKIAQKKEQLFEYPLLRYDSGSGCAEVSACNDCDFENIDIFHIDCSAREF